MSSGTVRVDEHDVRTVALGDLRQSAATVTDDPFLLPSIRDNVAFARPDASDGAVQAAIDDARQAGSSPTFLTAWIPRWASEA